MVVIVVVMVNKDDGDWLMMTKNDRDCGRWQRMWQMAVNVADGSECGRWQ